MDIAEKVEELKAWLSDRTSTEVESGFDPVADTYWFRVLLDGPLPAMLSVRKSVLEDHSVKELQYDLELLEVPGILGKEPSPHLVYERSGEVRQITLTKIIERLL